MWYKSIFLLFFCALIAVPAFSQFIIGDLDLKDRTQQQVVAMDNGTVLVGQIQHIKNLDLVMIVHNQEITLDLSKVTQIVVHEKGEDLQVLIEMINFSAQKLRRKREIKRLEAVFFGEENLLLQPTGFSLPEGKGRYNNFVLVWNEFEYGLTKNLTIGAGGIFPYMALIKGKFALSVAKKVHLAAGAMGFTGPFNASYNFSSYTYIASSMGNPKKHLNISAGYLFNKSSNGRTDRNFIYTVGGSSVLKSNWRISGEMFIINERADEVSTAFTTVIPSVGVSWFNALNRIDFGIAPVFSGFGGVVPIPYAGYARKF